LAGKNRQKIRPYGNPEKVENINVPRFDDVAHRKNPNLPKIPPVSSGLRLKFVRSAVRLGTMAVFAMCAANVNSMQS
jgi:hypothetical protein